MREKPTWANVEWLEQNVLAGQGVVSECQRKTKAWKLTEIDECHCRVRKVFRADVGGFAAWVSGTASSPARSYCGLGHAELYAMNLSCRGATSVSVPLFTSDPATGDWDALVLFERRGR